MADRGKAVMICVSEYIPSSSLELKPFYNCNQSQISLTSLFSPIMTTGLVQNLQYPAPQRSI